MEGEFGHRSGQKSGRTMAYDDILHHLGEFGTYQKRIYFLLCLPSISCALHKLSGIFLQAKVAHRCLLPYETENATYILTPEEVNMTLPWDNTKQSWSSCHHLDANSSSSYFNSSVPAVDSVPCDVWVYDTSETYSSTVTEWNLVCNDEWLRPTADASVMMGVLLGAIIFGMLSDRFGRKPIFFLSLVLQVTAGLLVAVAPAYIFFLIFRLISGMTASGVFLVSYIIAMEMVGPSKRLFTGVVFQYFFTLGFILTAVLAYFIRNWRVLQVALTLPGIVFLSYWWIIPESARWLLTKGRSEEAKQLLQKTAKINKISITNDLLDNLLPANSNGDEAAEKRKQGSLFDLMRYPSLRKRSLMLFFIWFVNDITYYGLSWNTSNLGGNDYLNFFILGSVELPAYTFLLLTVNRWGRKSILYSCMLLGGAALILTLAVPQDMYWLTILLVMIGKLAIAASYGILYVVTAEQFPTVIRNAALGASSMCARIGSTIAPFMILLAESWQPLPTLIFGMLTFVGGLLAILLPETQNTTLPDTIAEAEKFGVKVKDNE